MTCEHLERTSRYFDGDLADGTAAIAAEHLATCAACQELLATSAGLDAAMSATSTKIADQRLRDAVAAPTPLRRKVLLGGAVAALLAAAATVAIIVPTGPSDPKVADRMHDAGAIAIVLPVERAVAARFTGGAFAAHRPLVVLRGDQAREAIPLATLAALEASGDTAALVAALAASGDLTRAAELAAKLPDGDVDRAAIAIAQRDFGAALAHAYRALDRDPSSYAGWWNLALAAESLGLMRVARDAYARVTDPGWTVEAATRSVVLPHADDEFFDFTQRATAMIAGGAPLTVEDAQRFPALARIHFYDAVRTAATHARITELRELATAFGTPHTVAALDRVERLTDAQLATRATLIADYRALVGRTLADPAPLLARARAAGPAATDVLAGAAILASATKDLAKLVAPWADPWFTTMAERERIRAAFPPGDLRAAPALEAALAACTDGTIALRCGQLALDLATLHAATGLDDKAERAAQLALDRFRIAVSPAHERAALATLADQHRLSGKTALARAELTEVTLAAAGAVPGNCDVRRSAAVGLADLALADGAWDRVRAQLPPITKPPGCTTPDNFLATALAVDLARHTREPRDLDSARTRIALLAADDPAKVVAEARIDPSDAQRASLRTHLALTANDRSDALVAAIRGWAVSSLVDDAGAMADWSGAIEAALVEHETRLAPGACVAIASLDDDQLTVAVRAAGSPRGERRRVGLQELATATIISQTLADELAACTSIAVVARPPLHGRAELLPTALPWFFVGDNYAAGVNPTMPARALEVIDARPPPAAGLGALPTMPSRRGFHESLAGAAATPSAVLRALASATYVELHAHGVVASDSGDTAFLALSPEANGRFALAAADVRKVRLAGAPTIVLAACRASTVAPYLARRWSLPDAFTAAGASAVIGVDVPIDDTSARNVFDVLRMFAMGDPIAIERAVATIRTAPNAPAWARRLVVFR